LTKQAWLINDFFEWHTEAFTCGIQRAIPSLPSWVQADHTAESGSSRPSPSWRYTVEPRFHEPLFPEVLGITNDILCLSNGKIYGKEPRYNETSLQRTYFCQSFGAPLYRGSTVIRYGKFVEYLTCF